VDVRPTLGTIAALLLCGCEVYAVPGPEPCPGDRLGTFDFAETQVLSASDCFFAQPSNPAYQVVNPIQFPGTVNFGPGAADAAICVTVPHAMPRLGIHTGNHVTVQYTNRTGSVGGCTCATQQAVDAGRCLCPPNTLENCSCPVIVTEAIDGDLVPAAGGYSAFNGTQTVTVTSPFTSTVPPCDCQAGCTYTYTVTASSTGSR
jgi:hypothetical protein